MELKTSKNEGVSINLGHPCVQDVPNTLPHHLGKGGSPSHSAVLQEKKQHNGLRCKKCFELLVRDDEFMYEVYLCFSVAMPTGSYTRTLPF